MKLMKTQDAVGQVLCHDITQIIKGVTKRWKRQRLYLGKGRDQTSRK